MLFQHGVYQDLDVKSIGFNSQVMTCHLSHLRFPCTEIHGPVDRPKGVDPGLFARRLLGLCLEATGFFGETQTTKSLFFWKITKKWLVVFFPGKNDYKETVWEMICFFLRHWMIGRHTWPSWKPGELDQGIGEEESDLQEVPFFQWELMPRLGEVVSVLSTVTGWLKRHFFRFGGVFFWCFWYVWFIHSNSMFILSINNRPALVTVGWVLKWLPSEALLTATQRILKEKLEGGSTARDSERIDLYRSTTLSTTYWFASCILWIDWLWWFLYIIFLLLLSCSCSCSVILLPRSSCIPLNLHLLPRKLTKKHPKILSLKRNIIWTKWVFPTRGVL